MYHFCMLVFLEIETNVQTTVGNPSSAPTSKKYKTRSGERDEKAARETLK
jgi:hypothetical protein